jgi:hypothetical protein
MQVGDYVKLRDIPQNNRLFLKKYRNKKGKVIDEQTAPNRKNYLRVLFEGVASYEDLASWRVEKFFTNK